MFRFEHPDFLALLWAVPVLLLITVSYWAWRNRMISNLGNPESIKNLMPGFSIRRFWLKNIWTLMALTLLVIAFANPQLGAKKQKMTRKSADVFIALDISQSMLAQDVAPSRLERAREFVQQLVKTLEGEHIGLIFFAGNAFLQMPLSTDYTFILQSVQSADPEMISNQGTAIGSAIDLAAKSFDPDPSRRALILITDGEDQDEGALKSAETAYEDGMVLYPVGAGTSEGAPIPAGKEYKRDEQGAVVRTRLDEAMLIKLATAGGGRAFNIAQGEPAVKALRREVDGLQKRDIEVRSYSEFESWYQWFLLPALLLLLLDLGTGWRKRTARISILLVFVLFSGPAGKAQSAHECSRKGDRLYDLEKYGEAAGQYRQAQKSSGNDEKTTYNLGTALYMEGKYEESYKVLEKALPSVKEPASRADLLHNLGNAYLKQHKFAEAVEAYENSLRLRPGDPETKKNLQLAKKKLKEQKKQEEEKKRRQEQEQKQQPQNQEQQENQNQPQKKEQQQPHPQPQKQQQNQEKQEKQEQQPGSGKMTPQEATRLLETAISREDQKTARKYRALQQAPRSKSSKKDW